MAEITADNASLTNGTYKFRVYASDGVTRAKNAAGEDIADIVITYEDGSASPSGTVLVTDMESGSYVIEEIEIPSVMTLVEAKRGDNAAEAVGTGNKITVVVTKGDESAENGNAQAVFTNNIAQAEIKIFKVEKGNKAKPLSGAVFKLTKVVSADNDNEATENPYASGELTVDPQTGILTFTGLPAGRYRLEEKTSPVGYILVESPWFLDVDQYGTVTLEAGYTLASDGDNINEFYVENTPGAVLPNAGGPGTGLLYILGTMLISIAGVVFVMRRRRKVT